MGKIYQFINSLGRATTTSNSYNRVYINNTSRPSSHVDCKFAPNNEWTMVRPSIQVYIPCHSQVLTKLWIRIPDNFKPQTAKIEITNSAELTLNTRTISALISGRGQWLQIKFERSIAPDTQLRIAFNSISRNLLVRLPEYFVYSKSIDGKSSFVGRGYFE